MQDINTLTPSDLVNKLQDSSKIGNIAFIEDFFNSNWLKNKTNLSYFEKVMTAMINESCSNGHLDIVKLLLGSIFEQTLNNPHSIQNYFTNACKYGHLEIVKYLIDTPSVKIGSNFTTPFWGTIVAAEYGQLDVLKYLLEPSKNYLVNSPNSEGKILEAACRNNNVPILQYLVSLPNFTSPKNLESSFEVALEKGCLENIRYFVFDLNIEKNKYLSKLIKKNLTPSSATEVEKMFDSRDLSHSLQIELPVVQNKDKKMKV
jgi:hypothetical protein